MELCFIAWTKKQLLGMVPHGLGVLWRPRPGAGNCTRMQMSWRSTPAEVVPWFLGSPKKCCSHSRSAGCSAFQRYLEDYAQHLLQHIEFNVQAEIPMDPMDPKDPKTEMLMSDVRTHWGWRSKTIAATW